MACETGLLCSPPLPPTVSASESAEAKREGEDRTAKAEETNKKTCFFKKIYILILWENVRLRIFHYQYLSPRPLSAAVVAEGGGHFFEAFFFVGFAGKSGKAIKNVF